nr:MASE1 domain-containing protein [Bacteroidota bacterium]
MRKTLTRQNIWLRYFLQILFVASVYFILARLSLNLQFEKSNATPVWPPAGFGLAMILLWGYRVIPGIFFGAFAANLILFISHRTVDYPLAVLLSTAIALGNTGEALAGRYLIKKFIPGLDLKNFLSGTSQLFYFCLIAGIISLVSALAGSLTVLSASAIAAFQYPVVLLTWWLGDFSGIVLITSFILLWYGFIHQRKEFFHPLKYKITELILLFIATILMTGIVFDNWIVPYSTYNFAFWIIAIYVWAALRFDPRMTITTILISSIIAILGTISHKGTFAHLPLNEALISLQFFITIMVTTQLALSISVKQRKQTEISLREIGVELEERVKKRTIQLAERNQFVETILNSSIDSIIVLDPETRCISMNKIAKFNLRHPFPESIIGKKFSEFPQHLLPIGWTEDIQTALSGEMIHRNQIPSPISDSYFEIDYIPLFNESGVYAVLIIGRDVTERIQREKELREQKVFAELLIENSPYMIMAYDRQYKIIAWNKPSEEHNGLAKQAVMGKRMFELFPQYDNQEWKQTLD